MRGTTHTDAGQRGRRPDTGDTTAAVALLALLLLALGTLLRCVPRHPWSRRR